LKNLDLKKEAELEKLEKEPRKSYVETHWESKDKETVKAESDAKSSTLKMSFHKKDEEEKNLEEKSKLKGKGLKILKK
jgi:hypothetical protein